MREFDELKNLVNAAEAEVTKVDGGNKSAGTRLRKMLQEIKQKAQDARKAVLASRGAGE